MENHPLYIKNDEWSWFDGVWAGVSTVTRDMVSDYCLEQADKMRNSNLGNYDKLTAEQRERLAKLWESAINLPPGKYEYYFNLEDETEVFIKLVEELAASLGIDYELAIKAVKIKEFKK